MAFLFAPLAFGLAACFSGQPGRGVRLLAAAETLLRQRGMRLPEGDPVFMIYQQALERTRAQLDPAAFEAALQEGRALTMEQAVALATENESVDSQPPKA